MTTEPRPSDNPGDHTPLPLTPEQIRMNTAGMVYMRFISAGLEGFLGEGEHYRVAQLPSQRDGMPEMVLFARGDERVLSIHSIPDDDGQAREYRYTTTYAGIGYASSTPNQHLQVQKGIIGSGAPEEPIDLSDLAFLDGLLEHRIPIPEVIQLARTQVNAIMQPDMPQPPQG